MSEQEAWDEGFTACAGEHMRQREDPSHPITRTNPYLGSAPAADEREALRAAVGGVLVNAANYPDSVGVRVLGRDMGALIDKVTDAVLAVRRPESVTPEVGDIVTMPNGEEYLVTRTVTEPVTPETDGWPEMYGSAIEYALERLGVTDDYLPPDIAECPEGCEAEMGLKHLIWHLAERAVTPETDQRILAWERIGWHPAFKPCFRDGILIDHMMKRLDDLVELEATVKELAPAPVTPPTCKNGHIRTPENTYVSPKGIRDCRTCRAVWLEKNPQQQRGNQ